MNEKKKINLQEAMKQQLARKKQQSSQGTGRQLNSHQTKPLTSQLTKKPNNQRKRMGI
ncbi:hypothetical protein BpOF4_15965 [Alkalihalophilus pseudofirmus OF4]|uniref:Uncharacterized protein n=1 Tax=Alkalihalophilus pseudofirmus (strain ATCC BAA-2126 / JCM 17055 / OF4) TaxID=398511 RepID=D3G0T0_ALKPO|nr:MULTISPECIES: hypothetical protein [Alkalihalophilus]ADC51242.1 hypothetical protein BpOF4_15965 [Alkalihalophilus pseudofirmus OF4]MED1601830.1 hypothetical protein [Alkalihalophilus marmarensis]